MKYHCKKCNYLLIDTEIKSNKPFELICWHCGRKNIINGIDDNFIIDFFNKEVFNEDKSK